jgi:hypothetical protein
MPMLTECCPCPAGANNAGSRSNVIATPVGGAAPLVAVASAPPVTPRGLEATQPELQRQGSASVAEIEALRNEVAELRQEVGKGRDDMWSAMKTISVHVDRDQREMDELTSDIRTLRGRRGGVGAIGAGIMVAVSPSDCSARQSSCGACLGEAPAGNAAASPSCVWCEVEQRCVAGDGAGPLRGECTLFRATATQAC